MAVLEEVGLDESPTAPTSNPGMRSVLLRTYCAYAEKVQVNGHAPIMPAKSISAFNDAHYPALGNPSVMLSSKNQTAMFRIVFLI